MANDIGNKYDFKQDVFRVTDDCKVKKVKIKTIRIRGDEYSYVTHEHFRKPAYAESELYGSEEAARKAAEVKRKTSPTYLYHKYKAVIDELEAKAKK